MLQHRAGHVDLVAHVQHVFQTDGDKLRRSCGKKFDGLLSELGARRIGEIMFHDASSGTLPEELAAPWAVAWIEQAKAGAQTSA